MFKISCKTASIVIDGVRYESGMNEYASSLKHTLYYFVVILSNLGEMGAY